MYWIIVSYEENSCGWFTWWLCVTMVLAVLALGQSGYFFRGCRIWNQADKVHLILDFYRMKIGELDWRFDCGTGSNIGLENWRSWLNRSWCPWWIHKTYTWLEDNVEQASFQLFQTVKLNQQWKAYQWVHHSNMSWVHSFSGSFFVPIIYLFLI